MHFRKKIHSLTKKTTFFKKTQFYLKRNFICQLFVVCWQRLDNNYMKCCVELIVDMNYCCKCGVECVVVVELNDCCCNYKLNVLLD